MASQETSTTPADAAMAKRTCNAPGCSNPAKLQCPTCLKNQIPVALPLSFFCSQACFKAAWTEHKVLHALPLSKPTERACALARGRELTNAARGRTHAPPPRP